MAKIFICYRREDSIDIAGRISDRLALHFGREDIFIDVDKIPSGVDFREHLANAVNKCDVLLAVIGPQWLEANSKGNRRLDDSADFVRIEIESAINRGVSVVPVLTRGVKMPAPNQLPKELSSFAFQAAATVASGRDFHVHVDRLITDLTSLTTKRAAEQEAAARNANKKKPKKPPVKESAFKCVPCGKTFTKKAALLQHEADTGHGSKKKPVAKSAKTPVAAGPANRTCNTCGKTFKRELDRDNHVKSVHGNPSSLLGADQKQPAAAAKKKPATKKKDPPASTPPTAAEPKAGTLQKIIKELFRL